MTYRCDPHIGSLPMGTPDQTDIDVLLKTMKLHHLTLGGGKGQDLENRGRSEIIAKTASRILQAMIYHEPTAHQHVISHRFDAKPKHRFRLSGPIWSRNMDDDVVASTALRTLIHYAKKIRQLGPRTSFRIATARSSMGVNEGLVHPANLYYVATQGGNTRDAIGPNFVPTVNIQAGTPRYPWLKPVATAFNIQAEVPLTVIDSLPGRFLHEIVEIPDVLTPWETEAWRSLVIASASRQQVPLGARLNLTLEPAWEIMRDSCRPDDLWHRQWHELAAVAEFY